VSESSHCRLHGKGIEAPFEQRCDRHEMSEQSPVGSHRLLLDGTHYSRI